MQLSFPENWLLGVASAAAQIEGGALDSNWQNWYKTGHIKDGSDPAVADDHWARWREDTALMGELGVQVCRFGIEWARLMPEENRVDESAVAQYREEIQAMRALGIRPLLTVHHFSNPMWFEAKGGFRKRDNIRCFLRLVELVVDRFGDIVSEYITINEPNVYAVNGYFYGSWPPGHRSMTETVTVLSNLSCCHIRAYRMIHRMRAARGYTDTKVSFANHLREFTARDEKNPVDAAAARAAAWVFQGAVTRAMLTGEFLPPLVDAWHLPKGEYADFHGLNYYSRSTVCRLQNGEMPGTPRNDLDWEIRPEGIVNCARWLYGLLPRPIWVTENGCCDNEDRFRCRYIFEHLQAMAGSDLPFERYYHWCFCDNFEWLEGQSARFGLVHVDYATQQRRLKRSGEFYRAMLRERGVSEAAYAEYVAPQEYRVL